jgi:hypothetical protein
MKLNAGVVYNLLPSPVGEESLLLNIVLALGVLLGE